MFFSTVESLPSLHLLAFLSWQIPSPTHPQFKSVKAKHKHTYKTQMLSSPVSALEGVTVLRYKYTMQSSSEDTLSMSICQRGHPLYRSISLHHLLLQPPHLTSLPRSICWIASFSSMPTPPPSLRLRAPRRQSLTCSLHLQQPLHSWHTVGIQQLLSNECMDICKVTLSKTKKNKKLRK